MPKTIQQTVRFNVPVAKLFATYANSKPHSAAIGAPTTVSRTIGAKFSAFNGMIKGSTLAVIPQRLFVQTWRGGDWKSGVPDSLLFLMFEKKGKGSSLTMIHANVPDAAYAGIKKGWNSYYWKSWKAYFAKRKK